MRIKTLQWNIGGAKIRTENSDSAENEDYSKNGLDYIATIISRYNPDIITLQETHSNKNSIQAEKIAKQLGYYFVNDVYDHSHLEKGQELGQAIISRFPIFRHTFILFYNPKVRIERPNGEVWISHDKGYSKCEIDLGFEKIEVGTLHMIPFRKFNLDSGAEVSKQVIQSMEKTVRLNLEKSIVQGDFNLDSPGVKSFFPKIFSDGIGEIEIISPTTPRLKKYDHIIYKGIKVSSFKIDDTVLTDHYPLVATFEI